MGLLLVQLLVRDGVRVVGVVGSPDKAELVRTAGAAAVVQRGGSGGGDLAAQIREATHGVPLTYVFDSVGKDTFETDMDVIARKGHLCVYGNAVGNSRSFRLFFSGLADSKPSQASSPRWTLRG